MRLKLTAPVVYGRIAFVNVPVGRRGAVGNRDAPLHVHHFERGRHSAHRLGGRVRSSHGRARLWSVSSESSCRGYAPRLVSGCTGLVLPADRFPRLAPLEHHLPILLRGGRTWHIRPSSSDRGWRGGVRCGRRLTSA